jgi:glycosyltransferase involved in cell wall biosynthesis
LDYLTNPVASSFKTTNPRILYVVAGAELGGAEALLLNIVRFHDRTQFEPGVCFLRSGPLITVLQQQGVPVWLIPTGKLRQLGQTSRAIAALRRLIRQENVALVHSSMSWAQIFGGTAAWLATVPNVWYQHTRPDPRSWLDRLASAIPTTTIYANSQDTFVRQKQLFTRAKKIQLVYCGVDVDAFSPAIRPESSLALRAEYAIPVTAPVVIMPGRLQHWKGQTVFIEAARQVIKNFPNVYFLIVGDTLFGLEPDYKAALQAQVIDLPQIIFIGQCHDMAAIYQLADIVVHASLIPEPFGLVIAEAMAMARPVIASNQGGPAEIVIDGKTGYLISPGEPQLLAEKISTLLCQPAVGRQLGQAGRQRVVENFSILNTVQQLENDYREILKF